MSRLSNEQLAVRRSGYSNDIRVINEMRRDLAKRPLPVGGNQKWYKDIIEYAKLKYPKDPDFAVKVIASRITPYFRTKLNKTRGRTVAMINKVVNKTHINSNYSLDDVIRSQDISIFDSENIAAMSEIQEAIFKNDAREYLGEMRQAYNKARTGKLKGVRPR